MPKVPQNIPKVCQNVVKYGQISVKTSHLLEDHDGVEAVVLAHHAEHPKAQPHGAQEVRAARLLVLDLVLPGDPLVSTCGVERRGSSELLALAPAVSWPWVPAWGSLEPSGRDGENAQKMRKNGAKVGEIRPKRFEGELTKR